MNWKVYSMMSDVQKDWWNYHFKIRPSFNLRIQQVVELQIIFIFTTLAYLVAVEINSSSFLNLYFVFVKLTKMMFGVWVVLYLYDLWRIIYHKSKERKWLKQERLL